MIRAEVRFTGRVQGVGFRATALRVARGFAVSGWVRNEPDGSVFLIAEGDKEAVDAYLAELHAVMAPLIAASDKIVGNPLGERGFEVRR